MKPEPDMKDKPRSIWRRPWGGWLGLVGWFVILFAAVFFTLLALSLATEKLSMPTGQILLGSAIVALTLAIAIMLGIAVTRWLCCWRNFRRFLFGLACLATLIALFYAEENIRGKLAWNRYVREVEARGETLDLAKLIPPPVPDDQNFTLCPMLKPIFDFAWHESPDPADFFGGHLEQHDTNGLARLENFSIYSSVDNYIRALPSSEIRSDLNAQAKVIQASLPLSNGWVNLKGFEDYFLLGTNLNGVTLTDSAASNVLLALRPFDADLKSLKDCSRRRTLDRWSILYDTNAPYGILLPHLAKVKQFCQFLQLPASAKLATGDTAGAIEDMKLAHRFAESPRDEPMLISQLVRVASHRLNVQPLKEGLARHQFNEAQLKKLEAQYRSTDILSGAAMSMCGERSFAVITTMLMARNPRLLDLLDNSSLHESVSSKPLVAASLYIAPGGWTRQSQVSIGHLFDNHILGGIDEQSKVVDVAIAGRLESAAEDLGWPYGLFAKALVPGVGKALMRIVEGQTLMDQAMIACALERYHLGHGRYPDTLAALSPQYLEDVPHDVITGEPMIYRLLPDARYVLYSVGWDGNDDGGTPIKGERYDRKGNEDWVWQLPDPKLQPY